jgi:hypothetical protein
MKNFYEAMVIKPNLKLSCCLTLKVTHDSVPCIIKVNGQTMFEDDANGQTQLIAEHHFGFQTQLIETIDISIQLINRQHPNAVEVELTIDGHKILPKHQHLASPRTCYIDTNNIWQFKIDSFYPWLHEQTGQGWIA